MWILVASSIIISLTAPSIEADENSLKLTVEGPTTCVPIGEPFAVKVAVHNQGTEPARIAPLFIPSREYLSVIFRDNYGNAATVGDLVVNPAMNKKSFVLLPPDMFVGKEIKLSPEIREFSLYPVGLEAGTWKISAVIHLKSYREIFKWPDGLLPKNPTLQAAGNDICITSALPESVDKYLRQLRESDYEIVFYALAYFAVVRNDKASAILRDLIGAPEDWGNRFIDPLAAAMALRRQCDNENLVYFEQLLTGRYDDFARNAIKDLRSGKCENSP